MNLKTTLTGKKFARAALAGSIVTVMMGATAGTAAMQDIAEMTGTQTTGQGRWLTRLIAVPQGSVHTPYRSEATVNHAMAVQTFEGRHFLNASAMRSTGELARVDRSLKGDSLSALAVTTSAAVTIKPVISSYAPAKLALTSPDLQLPEQATGPALALNAPALSDDAAVLKHRQTEPTRLAFGFRSSKGIDANMYEAGVETTRKPLPAGQLADARAVAGNMTKVLAEVKKAAEEGDVTLAAYAPQDKNIARAFNAVLNPNRATGRIRLGRGDHKWAAKRLPAHARSKAERRCLANGVYFEARGESIKGQKAVAQVIVNRVKNPAYPNTICGVVYQNKHKRNACQFSFACDGIRDRIGATRQWNIAKKVANDAIDGRVWLSSVGSSSHYHADYVKPRWRRNMKRMVKIGRHIFYRTYGGGWS